MTVTVSRPLVSIVTPTLNQGRFIEQTIRSIRDQAYDNFEHIVVDGGSTDETLDILRRYEGTYPMRWVSEPDEGMYDAINKGMRQAKGDILAYLNSDDLYFPWTLEVVVEAFARGPGADFVFGDALGVYEQTGAQEPRFQPAVRYGSLVRGGYLIQPAVFWRREVQQSTGDFATQFKLAGDLDWWLRAGPGRRFVRVDEMVAVERDHASAKRLASWGTLIAESKGIRGGIDHAPAVVRRAGTVIERLRAWWARRLLWLRFLRAWRAGQGQSLGWARFMAASPLRIKPWRMVAAQLPWIGPRLDGGSIETSLDLISETSFASGPPTPIVK